MKILRLANTQSNSHIYGPGNRFVIWTQGCSLECPGCWNKEFWSFDAGYDQSVDELVIDIKKNDEIEGITILGGEPLEQSEAILSLIKTIKHYGLSVMLYTGFEEEELNNTQLECINLSDIVIMGRYIASLRDTSLRWRGSSNQQIKLISDVYSDLEIDEREEVEVTLDPDGKVSMVGYPQKWLLNLLNDL